MTYGETLEERDGYRVRLELDDDVQQPYDDGATPTLQIGGGYYGDGNATEMNKQAQGFGDIFDSLGSVAGTNAQHREIFARYLRIFHSTQRVQYWNEGVSNEYCYVAFDTAAWRESMGITDLDRLGSEDYLSEIRAWATGDVYGYIVEKYDDESEEWEATDDGTCWGLYGYDWAAQAAREALTEELEVRQ